MDTTIIIQKILSILSSLSLIVSSIGALPVYQNPASPLVGSTAPQAPALYDGYLASNILKTDTTMTLSTGTLKNGNSLSGFTCFSVDINTPTPEYICGTASGTSVTALMRGVDVSNPNATSSSLAYPHRRLASVSITDYPTIQFLTRQNNGTDSFPNIIYYDPSITTAVISATGTQALVTKGYVASQTVTGCSDANETTRGCSQLATGLQSASSTSLGSTGSRLVIPASLATSTPGNSTGVGNIPALQNNAKLAQGFLDLTQGYTWTGTHNFTANVGIGTSTPYASLSVAGSSGIVANLFTATSTTATSSIAGNLTIANNASTTRMTISGQCNGCVNATQVTNTIALPTTLTNTATQTATCTGTQKVVGGGYSGLTQTIPGGGGDPNFQIVTNDSPSSATAWNVSVICAGGGSSCPSGTLTVYAMCAQP